MYTRKNSDDNVCVLVLVLLTVMDVKLLEMAIEDVTNTFSAKANSDLHPPTICEPIENPSMQHCILEGRGPDSDDLRESWNSGSASKIYCAIHILIAVKMSSYIAVQLYSYTAMQRCSFVAM